MFEVCKLYEVKIVFPVPAQPDLNPVSDLSIEFIICGGHIRDAVISARLPYVLPAFRRGCRDSGASKPLAESAGVRILFLLVRPMPSGRSSCLSGEGSQRRIPYWNGSLCSFCRIACSISSSDMKLRMNVVVYVICSFECLLSTALHGLFCLHDPIQEKLPNSSDRLRRTISRFLLLSLPQRENDNYSQPDLCCCGEY